MTMWVLFDDIVFTVGFGAGCALIWFLRPKIEELVIGTNALSKKLHAQADALTVKATAAVDAAKKA
jgi:hypothetical protein